jgi:DNA polymerase III subunit gamma/tau
MHEGTILIPSTSPISKSASPISKDIVKETIQPVTQITEPVINSVPSEKTPYSPISSPVIAAKFGELNLRSKFSITKKSSTDESETQEVIGNKASTTFTFDELKAKWNTYTHLLNKEGRVGLAATLSKNPFEVDEQNVIHLPVDNRIQQMELDARKVDLLTFLRHELNNYTIDLRIEVNEAIDDVQHLTSKDKFLKMAEKNPFLQVLRERLDLDLEY